MTNLSSINQEQRLYVIEHGDSGFTCLGFDVAERFIHAVGMWIDLHFRLGASFALGTPEHYAEYCRVMAAGAEHAKATGNRCPADLTPQLIGLEGKRVEVVDSYGEKRRFQVGKSTGWVPCHLEIPRRNSSDGPAVMGAPFKSIRVVAAYEVTRRAD